MIAHQPPTLTDRRNTRMAMSIVAVACVMLGLSFAAVPLYQLFCRATGYGGTTQVATDAPETLGSRTLTVRFDTNIASDLPWTFVPEETSMRVRTGETKTVFFKVTNHAKQKLTGLASYNVTPEAAGSWFNKISCFCFSELSVSPGETIELPVVFFLDPALEREATMAGVESVTLSYTFYAAKKAKPASVKPLAASEEKGKTQL
ncbi:MAG: cytochrome c oxidase assembly protein [Alphaproteobacteria bacterium]|nr:cytochrome c oxidase assembly protein [Alphaproteobacteria bacterium]